MKEEEYTDIICKRFCTFYKEEKEELQCGSYLFLRERYSPGELEVAITGISDVPSRAEDKTINDAVCSKCEFLVDGCGYREGHDSPPCGGYIIVEHLIRKGS